MKIEKKIPPNNKCSSGKAALTAAPPSPLAARKNSSGGHSDSLPKEYFCIAAHINRKTILVIVKSINFITIKKITCKCISLHLFCVVGWLCGQTIREKQISGECHKSCDDNESVGGLMWGLAKRYLNNFSSNPLTYIYASS